MTESCRFCFKTKTVNCLATLSQEKYMEMTSFLFPFMRINSTQKICNICSKLLETYYYFKKGIIDTECKIAKKIIGKKNLTMREVFHDLFINDEHENKHICRICLRFTTDNFVYLYETVEVDDVPFEFKKEMIETVQYINFKAIKEPIMCDKCWKALQLVYDFLDNYKTSQEEMPSNVLFDSSNVILEDGNILKEEIPDDDIKIEETIKGGNLHSELEIKQEDSICEESENQISQTEDDQIILEHSSASVPQSDKNINNGNIQKRVNPKNNVFKLSSLIERPNWCAICNFSCPNMSSLNLHMNIHNNQGKVDSNCVNLDSFQSDMNNYSHQVTGYRLVDCSKNPLSYIKKSQNNQSEHKNNIQCKKRPNILGKKVINLDNKATKKLVYTQKNIKGTTNISIKTCFFCKMVFFSFQKFIEHMKINHKVKAKRNSYNCERCAKTFKNIQCHFRQAHIVEIQSVLKVFYKCSKCFMKLSNIVCLTQHYSNEHSLKFEEGKHNLTCSYCKIKITRPEIIDEHIKKLHADKKIYDRCETQIDTDDIICSYEEGYLNFSCATKNICLCFYDHRLQHSSGGESKKLIVQLTRDKDIVHKRNDSNLPVSNENLKKTVPENFDDDNSNASCGMDNDNVIEIFENDKSNDSNTHVCEDKTVQPTTKNCKQNEANDSIASSHMEYENTTAIFDNEKSNDSDIFICEDDPVNFTAKNEKENDLHNKLPITYMYHYYLKNISPKDQFNHCSNYHNYFCENHPEMVVPKKDVFISAHNSQHNFESVIINFEQEQLSHFDFSTIYTTQPFYECFHCGVRSKYKANLLKHIAFKHSQSEIVNFEDDELANYDFSSIHTVQLFFECFHCGKKFTEKSHLEVHITLNHSKENIGIKKLGGSGKYLNIKKTHLEPSEILDFEGDESSKNGFCSSNTEQPSHKCFHCEHQFMKKEDLLLHIKSTHSQLTNGHKKLSDSDQIKSENLNIQLTEKNGSDRGNSPNLKIHDTNSGSVYNNNSNVSNHSELNNDSRGFSLSDEHLDNSEIHFEDSEVDKLPNLSGINKSELELYKKTNFSEANNQDDSLSDSDDDYSCSCNQDEKFCTAHPEMMVPSKNRLFNFDKNSNNCESRNYDFTTVESIFECYHCKHQFNKKPDLILHIETNHGK